MIKNNYRNPILPRFKNSQPITYTDHSTFVRFCQTYTCSQNRDKDMINSLSVCLGIIFC